MSTSWKAALLAGAAVTMFSVTAAVAQDSPANPPARTGMEAAQQNEPLSPQDQSDPVTAATQQAGERDTDEVAEVVVTARRREESLQDVPIAVSAFSGERLEQLGAQDITTLQQTSPNTTVQIARGSNSTLIGFIRGVGQQDPLWGFEPGVGLYIDDVYVARPQGAVLDIFDVQRIEVLRGPQGTLYGRNTIGGAIKYVTDRVGSEPELKVRGQFGSYGQNDYIIMTESPLAYGFAFTGAVAKYNRGGFGVNQFTGADHYNRDVLAARGALEWDPGMGLFFRLSGDSVVDKSNPRHGHREVATAAAPRILDTYDTRAGSGDDNKVETGGVSLLAQWEASDSLTFKSITAYRGGQTRGTIDFDNLPQPLLDIPAQYKDRQVTQEFQALYEGERLQGVAGVYYLNGTASGAFDTVVGAANLTTLTTGYVQTKSFAVFADVSFDVTEQLSVSAGGRWTTDDKKGSVFRQNYLGIRSPFFGNRAALPLGAPRTNYTRERTFEEFTPRVSATYEFSPDLTAYASYGRGFKSGGFDMRGDAVNFPGTVEGYEPELVDTAEVGLKGSLLDRRINFATAIFSSDYKDQQITSQFALPSTPPSIVSFVDNAGSSKIRGWEFEGSARLADFLTYNVALGYTDAEFEEFLTFDPTCVPPPGSTPAQSIERCRANLAGQRGFQNTPEWTAFSSLTFRAAAPMGLGELTFTPSASYRGAYQLFEIPLPVLDQDAYTLIDATLLWTLPGERLRISLQGRNLTDERYRVGGYNFPGALLGDAVIGFYCPPRTFTAVFEMRF